MEFPIIFPKCPACGCPDTVARLACADDPSVDPTAFASLEKLLVPIQDLSKLTTPTVKAFVVHYDVCAQCGTRYCTKAEIIFMPVRLAPGTPGTPGARPPFGRG